ncbi:MAG: hypothetical protein ACREGJ_01480 [Candidatus Saccharimonadales bacterium]
MARIKSHFDESKRNVFIPFISAFAGMLVAIPVAVVTSVYVAKAVVGQEVAQAAHSVPTANLSSTSTETPVANCVEPQQAVGGSGQVLSAQTTSQESQDSTPAKKVVKKHVDKSTHIKKTEIHNTNITHTTIKDSYNDNSVNVSKSYTKIVDKSNINVNVNQAIVGDQNSNNTTVNVNSPHADTTNITKQKTETDIDVDIDIDAPAPPPYNGPILTPAVESTETEPVSNA